MGVDRPKVKVKLRLRHKIGPSLSMPRVVEKPDITPEDLGGLKVPIERTKEVAELPMLHMERFERLWIGPPNCVLLCDPSVTGNTLIVKAVANRTDITFITYMAASMRRSTLVRAQRWDATF